MLDIKWIRENPQALDGALAKRGAAPKAADLIALDDARRAHITKLQSAQERRNAASKEIGKAKAARDEETATRLIDEVSELKAFIQSGEDEERRLFYVAVTRAEQLLFMSYPMISETHDFQRIINRPSRFLTKLPDGSYDEAQLEWNDNDW